MLMISLNHIITPQPPINLSRMPSYPHSHAQRHTHTHSHSGTPCLSFPHLFFISNSLWHILPLKECMLRQFSLSCLCICVNAHPVVSKPERQLLPFRVHLHSREIQGLSSICPWYIFNKANLRLVDEPRHLPVILSIFILSTLHFMCERQREPSLGSECGLL